VELADELRLYAKKAATKAGISGFVIVFSSTGMQLCSSAVGPVLKPMSVQIAHAKIETVLARQQSVSVWLKKIEKTGTRPENYAGAIKTLFGGGLAIFADEAHTEFVGAIAFSGGEEWEDQEICQEAISATGLFTDDISLNPGNR